MTELVGGVRSRLIHDSLVAMIETYLTTLGWFDPTVYDNPPGHRQHRPLKLIERPNNWDDPVETNAWAVTAEDVRDSEAEIGSLLSEDRRIFAVDIYCENDQIGTHLRDDIRDIIRGKFSTTTDRTGPVLPIVDYRQAIPDVLFYCDIENIVADRAHNFPHPWQQHWWSITFEIVDTYGDEQYGG